MGSRETIGKRSRFLLFQMVHSQDKWDTFESPLRVPLSEVLVPNRLCILLFTNRNNYSINTI